MGILDFFRGEKDDLLDTASKGEDNTNERIEMLMNLSMSDIHDYGTLYKKIRAFPLEASTDVDLPKDAARSFMNPESLIADIEEFRASVRRGDSVGEQTKYLKAISRTGAGVRDPKENVREAVRRIAEEQLSGK